MTPDELSAFLRELVFERDVRKRPDGSRRERFRQGFRHGASGHSYSPSTLRRLTWQNLGFQLGARCSARRDQEIDAIFDTLASQWSVWAPRLFEDFLLQAYWRRARGRIYVEVPLGGPGGDGDWQAGCTTRRVDGVRIEKSQSYSVFDAIARFERAEFCTAIRSCSVELIEVKPRLNRPAIGQVIAGRDMFERQYGVTAGRCVIVCEKSDSALEWVCQRHDIQVEVVAVPNDVAERVPRR